MYTWYGVYSRAPNFEASSSPISSSLKSRLAAHCCSNQASRSAIARAPTLDFQSSFCSRSAKLSWMRGRSGQIAAGSSSSSSSSASAVLWARFRSRLVVSPGPVRLLEPTIAATGRKRSQPALGGSP